MAVISTIHVHPLRAEPATTLIRGGIDLLLPPTVEEGFPRKAGNGDGVWHADGRTMEEQ